MEVQRLGAKDYDAIIGLLNEVFSRKNKRQMDFEKEMPKMCFRDEEHMGCHFGIFEDNRLVACMGVYPFEVTVAGKVLKFATTGNIAVHWNYEGRGYMGAMVERAMQELERLNVDTARLGGLRSRYNRYGFEACGQNYTFTFTEKNRINKFPQFKDDITFKEIEANDKEYLSFTAELYNKNAITVHRTGENAYLSLTMWLNKPYITLRDGIPVGYICANSDGSCIAELFAKDTDTFTSMVCAWQKRCGSNITFPLQMHQIEQIRVFSAVCESSVIHSPSHFKIRNWADFTDAFIKLKASYCKMPQGELYIGITDYGTIRLYVNEKGAGCEKTDHTPDITLDGLSAARYIFGPYPPICTADTSYLVQAWFPLPLSWNGQDRV